MSDFDEELIRRLGVETALSSDQARRMVEGARGFQASAPLIDEAKWEAAIAKPDTVPISAFMLDHQLDQVAMRELLREFRAEGGYSPFEYGQSDELGAEFLNWFEWERLG